MSMEGDELWVFLFYNIFGEGHTHTQLMEVSRPGTESEPQL